MIEIVPYGPKWEQAHIAFASKYWTKSRRKIPDYIYWKFRGRPNQEITSFLLAVENNEVIGQLGLIPVNVRVVDELYEAQWACDLMVDTSYRGKGVAKMLYDEAHKQKELTIGSDPSPAASASMQKNGYLLMTASWKCFFPLNLNEITKLKGINQRFLNVIPNPFLLKYYIWNILHPNTFESITLNDFEEKKEAPDKKIFVSVERNQS
ncbi:MAG: GNAT family N-acetyltransferase, partial [Flavobacterium sp.]|nr:GNAT family N-acetyltransferase [Flavobacterium sp.]